MGYKFNEQGFMVIPDTKQMQLKKELAEVLSDKIVVVRQAFCPNGHNVVQNRYKFSGFAGIHLKAEINGNKGDLILSPIFGDHSHITIDIDINLGDQPKMTCPICGVELPILKKCENCESGNMLVLSMREKFDITDGIAFCDVAGCPSAYILDAEKLINEEYLKGY